MGKEPVNWKTWVEALPSVGSYSNEERVGYKYLFTSILLLEERGRVEELVSGEHGLRVGEAGVWPGFVFTVTSFSPLTLSAQHRF